MHAQMTHSQAPAKKNSRCSDDTARVASAAMDQDHVDELRATLKRVENISEFSRRAELSLATLMRFRAGSVTPTKSTMKLVAAALKRFKPALRPPE